ncbi:hypothetical protein V499_04814 [Pseudogymnoascus sp. VKM F-103]|nr:hypothetical protein V499_04814 [Pseudogymnoascus sp. VKM F-103]
MVGGIHDDIIPDSDDKSIVDADADSNYGLDAIDGELGTVDKTFSGVPTRVRGILQGLEDFARKIRYDKAQEKPTYPLSFSSGLSSVLYRRNNSW